jgi:hypothetical protein
MIRLVKFKIADYDTSMSRRKSMKIFVSGQNPAPKNGQLTCRLSGWRTDASKLACGRFAWVGVSAYGQTSLLGRRTPYLRNRPINLRPQSAQGGRRRAAD